MIFQSLQHLDRDSFFATICVSLINYAGLISLSILPIFIGALIKFSGLSIESSGVVAFANLLGIAIGLVVVILSIGRLSLVPLAVVGGVLTLVFDGGCLIYSTVLSERVSFDPASFLTTLRFLVGIANGLLVGVAYNWFSRQILPDRGYGLALLMQFGVGGTLIYLISPWIESHGIAVIYLVYISFALLALLLMPVLLAKPLQNPNDESVAESISEVSTNLNIGASLLGISIFLSLLGIGIFEIVNSGIWAYWEKVGIDWQVKESNIIVVLTVGALTGMLGAGTVVALGDRWGRTRPILLGIVISVIPLILIVFGPSSVTNFTLCVILLNFAWSFTLPYLQGVITLLDPQGRVLVVSLVVVMVSVALGPLLVGWLYAAYGLVTTSLLMLVLFGLCLVAFLPPMLKTERGTNPISAPVGAD